MKYLKFEMTLSSANASPAKHSEYNVHFLEEVKKSYRQDYLSEISVEISLLVSVFLNLLKLFPLFLSSFYIKYTELVSW